MKGKFHFLLYNFIFILLSTIHAGIVPENLAKGLALNFYHEKLSAFENIDKSELHFQSVIEITEDETVLFYAINFKRPGFILISADDRLFPVLAYSFEGLYNENDSFPEFTGWINNYKKQIKHTIKEDLLDTQVISSIWNKYSVVDSEISSGFSKAIAPLTYSKWGQGAFYNASCPVDTNGSGGHVYAGCVAVAISQVLYYFRYPEWGEGSHGYESDYGYLFVDFENSNYKWNEMVDLIHEYENPAIADLLYNVGVSVDMNYAPTSSGSQTVYAVEALKNYFRYSDDLMYIKRVELGNSFKDSVIKCLDQKIPLIYRGGDISSHSFVCDGYQDSTFLHFNWGWRGKRNGYYYIDNLNPGSYDFTYDQCAIINIYPEESYPVYCLGHDTLKSTRGTFTDGSGNKDYLNNSTCKWLISPEDTSITNIQLSFNYFDTEENKDSLVIFDGSTENDPVLAVFSGDEIPETISSSGDQLLFVFSTDSVHSKNGWYVDYLAYSDPFCTSFNEYNSMELHGISDGSGPYDYTNLSDCNWLVAPQSDVYDSVSSIHFWFNEFDIASDDTLFLFDGTDEDFPVIGAYSGIQVPEAIETSGNKLFVVFKTDEINTSDGWDVSYQSILPVYCEDTLLFTANNGSFDDGSGNKNYLDNSECFWKIEPENAKSIAISFSSFDMEYGYDRLYIYDNEEDIPYLLETYTGHDIPNPKTINTGKALIRFSTDESIIAEGWEVIYDVVEPGIAEVNPEPGFSIFPNPAMDFITINGLIRNQKKVNVEIFSIDGKMVFSESYLKFQNEDQIEMKLPSLPEGIWFIGVSGFLGQEKLIIK